MIDKSFVPDGAAGALTDGTLDLHDVTTLGTFPYLDHPVSGYDVLPLKDPAA